MSVGGFHEKVMADSLRVLSFRFNGIEGIRAVIIGTDVALQSLMPRALTALTLNWKLKPVGNCSAV